MNSEKFALGLEELLGNQEISASSSRECDRCSDVNHRPLAVDQDHQCETLNRLEHLHEALGVVLNMLRAIALTHKGCDSPQTMRDADGAVFD